METKNVREFYASKNVFITGGSGFIGKVLIEKLLRSSPELGTVYVLLRPKKGKSLEERIKTITDLPLFDLLRSENPDALKKIKTMKGDVRELGLGLSEEDKETLINEVDIIFHGAASVRFDDSLRDAIIMNTRGTREVALLAQQMKNLLVMVHISTSYCHTERDVIDECLYPPHADWRDSIKLAETMDSHTMEAMSAKYIDKQPNTYTFSKSLSEHVVNDLCQEKGIPLVILRPSIVTSSFKEPMPGWIDNLNGPVGLSMGVSEGILRSLYGDPNAKGDYIPVDVVVKMILISAWVKGTEPDSLKMLETSVYNATSCNIIATPTMKEMVEMGLKLKDVIPSATALFYPYVTVTRCRYNHFLRLIFYHILPALIVDGLLRTFNKKPLLFKIQRKIYIANMVLDYFMSNYWTFLNSKSWNLEKKLKDGDLEEFRISDYAAIPDFFEYFNICVIGGRKYLFKEYDIEKAKRNNNRLRIMSKIFNILWYAGLFYILFYKLDLLGWFFTSVENYYLYLANLLHGNYFNKKIVNAVFPSTQPPSIYDNTLPIIQGS